LRKKKTPRRMKVFHLRKNGLYFGSCRPLCIGDAKPGRPPKRNRKPWQAPKVKTLAEEDLDKYTVFDVIMPLPGRDVDYPGGSLGERYKQLIQADGLDPMKWTRKHK
jgi:tRNA pseudouridine13 synthase